MNNSLRLQQTLANTATIKGFGYWSGLDVQVQLKPAPENTGIIFVRPDLPDCPRLNAHVSQRIDMSLRTVLDNGRMRVEMVEHLMASLAALQIDNCEVWLDRTEMPGLDGSAKDYVDAILDVGIETQESFREKLIVTHKLRVGNEDAWIEAQPALKIFKLDYELDFPGCAAIGKQAFELELNSETFTEELAAARTFILESEAQKLREQGLCDRVSFSDLLVFGKDGVIDNELRYPNECVRHKMLDFVGDFALAPFDIVGHFSSYRSGHQLHAQMIHRLLQEGQFIGATRAA